MGSVQAASCGLFSMCAPGKHDASTMVLDRLIRQLFELQDLNGNGMLEEDELIQLNKKVAMLHRGKDTDTEEVKAKYQELFRTRLDPDGKPVCLQVFRGHIMDVLQAIDPSEVAQSYILEQWIAEADLARCSFQLPSFHSISDVPFLLVMPKSAPEVEPPPLASSDSALTGQVKVQACSDKYLSAPPPSEVPSTGSSLSKDAMAMFMSLGSRGSQQVQRAQSCHRINEELEPAQQPQAPTWAWPVAQDGSKVSDVASSSAVSEDSQDTMETRSLGSSQGPL